MLRMYVMYEPVLLAVVVALADMALLEKVPEARGSRLCDLWGIPNTDPVGASARVSVCVCVWLCVFVSFCMCLCV